MKKGGFTLIELLVVISIISLLASVVFASVSLARAKASDIRKIAQVSQVRTALASFNLDNNRMPYNYTCTSACAINTDPTTVTPAVEGTAAFNASMQELVAGNYIPTIPKSESGDSYLYYNNIAAGTNRAIFLARLQNTLPVNAQSLQCAWENFSNFDQTIWQITIGNPNFYNPNFSYFINAVSCYEEKLSGQTPVPNSECTTMAANPLYAGKCFLREKQTILGGYQTVTYFSSYSGTCLGPVVQPSTNNPPVTIANFGLSGQSLTASCSKGYDYCACYP